MSDEAQEVLLQEISPFGSAQALVVDDGRTVYFYLRFAEDAPGPPLKAVWVRNRMPAPQTLLVADAQAGNSLLMPADCCADAAAGAPLSAEELRIVWFEEGDGAALFENEELLAVMPCWAGRMANFHGYARDCVRESPLAWPLPTNDVLTERLAAAEAYWSEWDDEDFWPRMRDAQVAAWEEVYGPTTRYYAIDGGNWPPKALLRFDLPHVTLLCTVGMSLLAQPEVEMTTDRPGLLRRVELASAVAPGCPEEELKRWAEWLSAQTEFPWRYFAFLGAGHTMPCRAAPAAYGGEAFSSVLFAVDPADVPEPERWEFRGDPVNVLWCVPITASERDLAVEQGSATLEDRLLLQGVGAIIRRREPVA